MRTLTKQLALSRARRLHVVGQATHLFEEPGALEQVARLAADWFTTHLGDTATREVR